MLLPILLNDKKILVIFHGSLLNCILILNEIFLIMIPEILYSYYKTTIVSNTLIYISVHYIFVKLSKGLHTQRMSERHTQHNF